MLDVKRFSDGSYRVMLLGEKPDPEHPDANVVQFRSSDDAQAFVSAWYGTPDVFHVERER